MKRIWVLTLFPDYFEAFSQRGVIGQVLQGQRGQFEFKLVHLRDYSDNQYKSVDETPFGGGAGMVLRADILSKALWQGVIQAGGYDSDSWKEQLEVIYPCPRGITWNQRTAENFAQERLQAGRDLVFLCGRYEGVDERFLEKYVQSYFSLGDYVLSGGELAVMVMLDSSLRLLPGSLGNQHSLSEESFNQGLLEYPLYTKPREFEGQSVPEVLLSGHHKRIQEFHLQKRIQMTQKHRPDLWDQYLKQEKK